ncbi:MAG: polysaccharide pyruvyl transferase family protein [Vicinamibacterales bacterium]
MPRSEPNGLKVFNVWHIGAWNRNVGDWALAYQMHRLLNQQARSRQATLKFHMVDSQRTYFYPELVDQMNEEADLVLIGGGGLIFLRPEDQSVSGWSFNIQPGDLARIKPPIVVHGIGYNRFAHDPQPFPSQTGPHLRQLQSQAALFSVRNHGTHGKLVNLFGLDPLHLDVVPDAGIALADRPIRIPARRPGAPIVAINWAGDRPGQRFAPPAEENARRFWETMKEALRRVVEVHDAQVMFLPHLMNIDTDAYADFAASFPAGSVFSTHLELPYLYPPPGESIYAHIPFFTNLFRQASVVLGMRLHTCILAFGAGTPFIPLGSHPKVHYFADDVGATKYRIPMADVAHENADAMYGAITACLDDSVYRESLKLSLSEQLQRLRQFHERILDVLAAGPMPATEVALHPEAE